MFDSDITEAVGLTYLVSGDVTLDNEVGGSGKANVRVDLNTGEKVMGWAVVGSAVAGAGALIALAAKTLFGGRSSE